MREYWICGRDGQKKEHTSTCDLKKRRPNQKPSRKLNDTCLSRMTVDHLASHNVRVTYYAAHTGHTLNTGELTHLPLPTSTSEVVEKKLSIGVTAERILQGTQEYAAH